MAPLGLCLLSRHEVFLQLPGRYEFTGAPSAGREAQLALSSVLVPLPIAPMDFGFVLPFRNACADGFEEESSGGEASGRGQDRGLHAHHGADRGETPSAEPRQGFPHLFPQNRP